jgi:hypothetical protein
VADLAVDASFNLIDAQCPNDLADTEVTPLADAEMIKFQFTSFLFAASDEQAVLHFSCDVSQRVK